MAADVQIESMIVHSEDYIDGLTVRMTDKNVVFGSLNARQKQTTWTFSTDQLVGFNGKAQEERIHSLAALVYNPQCGLAELEEFNEVKAELEEIVERREEE